MRHSLFIGVLLFGSAQVAAAPAPLSPSLYYEVGGGTSFQRPLSESTIAPELSLSADLNLPLSCDIWDVKDIAVANYPDLIVDYLEGQLDQLGQAVVAQLTAIGQGLAVAALQRALPGIYDLSQTLTAQISARVDVAKRSCEDVVNDLQNGVNPLDPWKNIGKSVSWRASLTGATSLNQEAPVGNPDAGGGPQADTPEASTSIIDAQRIVAANGTTAPIPWFGGEVAGDAENPIMVVGDLVTAGYNIFLDETGGANDGSGLADPGSAEGVTVEMRSINGSTDEEIRLGQLFEDTEAAVDWANRFIGEQEVYMCEEPAGSDCEASFRAGVGLQVLVNDEVEELVDLWLAVVAADDAGNSPGFEELQELSSQSVQVTVDLYDALMRFPAQDQNVYIGRLISDVALARSVEKALAIRRMILVSSDSPIVKGYAQAKLVTEEIVKRIRREIEDTMWAVDTQSKLASGVSQSVLTYDAIRESNYTNTLGNGEIVSTTTFIGNQPESP